jgi:transaldolase
MTLSRNLLLSGKLQQLIDTRSVVGVTTNRSTFERALNQGRAYDGQIAELTARGTDIDTATRTVVTDDVRAACDVLRPRWRPSAVSTGGCLSRSIRDLHTAPMLSVLSEVDGVAGQSVEAFL